MIDRSKKNMADQVEKRTFENEEKDSKNIESNVTDEKEHKFKKATVKLKAEALRRFKIQEEEENQVKLDNKINQSII